MLHKKLASSYEAATVPKKQASAFLRARIPTEAYRRLTTLGPPPPLVPDLNGTDPADCVVAVVGPHIHLAREGQVEFGGGPDGRKFNWVVFAASAGQPVVQPLALMPGVVDPRDFAEGVANLERLGLTHAEIAHLLACSRSAVTEILGTRRIAAAVNELIDASVRWPTIENVVHLSKGRTEDEQRARWLEIEDGRTRRARRSQAARGLTRAKEAREGPAVAHHEAQEVVDVQRLHDGLTEPTASCVHNAVSQQIEPAIGLAERHQALIAASVDDPAVASIRVSIGKQLETLRARLHLPPGSHGRPADMP